MLKTDHDEISARKMSERSEEQSAALRQVLQVAASDGSQPIEP
ncbi:MAG: hypothetical protein U0441_15895 [Polyangiaceae bacterium]